MPWIEFVTYVLSVVVAAFGFPFSTVRLDCSTVMVSFRACHLVRAESERGEST